MKKLSMLVLIVLLVPVLASAQTEPTNESLLNKSNLLFPWVVAYEGYDTGIAVNYIVTGSAPGKTLPNGEAVLHFFPADGSESFELSLGTLKPGQTKTFVASSLKKSFTGYVIVTCEFGSAQGLALIDYATAPVSSMSQVYTALRLNQADIIDRAERLQKAP